MLRLKKVYLVSFSGGKDSTAMLLKLIEKGYPIDEIICCDTGKEFDEMYDHIKQVEQNIDIPITRLKSEKSFDYYMFEHQKSRGKHKDKLGLSWADFRYRWCTIRLKQDVINKYIRNKYPKKEYEVYQYIGIALDERQRADKVKDEHYLHPLISWRMTEKDCLTYCYSKGYHWGGLYEKFDRVSCWCCPLKNLKELRVLYHDFPDKWKELKEMDERTYRKFRRDYTVKELEEKFKKEDEQN